MSEHPAKTELSLAKMALGLAVKQLAAAMKSGQWKPATEAAMIQLEADLTAKLEVVRTMHRLAKYTPRDEAL